MKFVRYVERDSFLHSLDPRSKLLICLTLISLPFVFTHPLAMFLIFCGMIAVAFTGKIGDEFLKRVRFLLPVAIMAFLLWSLFYNYSLFTSASSSQTLLKMGPLRLTQFGLWYGVAMSFKILVLIGTPLLFFLTVTNSDFTMSLVKLKVPYKVAFGIGLALRMIGVFEDEMTKIKQAQKSRGLALEKGNLLSRVRKSIPIIIPTIFSGLETSDQLSTAMELKGFGSQEERTFLKNLRLQRKDFLVMVVCVGIIALSIFLRMKGVGVM